MANIKPADLEKIAERMRKVISAVMHLMKTFKEHIPGEKVIEGYAPAVGSEQVL